MDVPLILARVLHISLGVFWVGTIVFNAIFLSPSMRDAGPDGAKVAAGLMKRRFLDVMPLVALTSILSGLYLLWRASIGFAPAYMGSRIGIAYSTGLLVTVVAFGLGVGVLRPAMRRAAALSQQAATAAPDERASMMATAQAMRVRAGAAGTVVAGLLVAVTITMSVARYL